MIHRMLRLVRQFHNLTQTELADKIGISKSYLCELEAGKKVVSIEILNKYSEVFDVPVSSLVFFSENMSKKEKLHEKFRTIFSEKIMNIMEWIIQKNESKKAEI